MWYEPQASINIKYFQTSFIIKSFKNPKRFQKKVFIIIKFKENKPKIFPNKFYYKKALKTLKDFQKQSFIIMKLKKINLKDFQKKVFILVKL